MAVKLPGISFQTVPPVPEEVLPRMDIAAFVGFASSGPLHIPVPVEDVERFRDIFGADLPLAPDESTGKMQYALLPQVVESFFRNGGIRCWIVRVAGEGAKYNLFSLPGIAAVSGSKILQAQVRARAQGSWSDDIMAGAVLASRNIEINKYTDQNGVHTIVTPSHVEKGDLLRLDTANAFLLLAVDSVEKKNVGSATKFLSLPESTLYNVTGSRGFWFTKCLSISYKNAEVFYISPDGEIHLPHSRIIKPGESIPYFRIELETDQHELPHPGSLLRINIDENRSVFLTVSGIESTNETFVVRGKYPQCMNNSEPRPLKSWRIGEKPDISACILNFELFGLKDKDKLAQLNNLSFVPEHPRFFGKLPSDEELFSKKIFSSLDEDASLPRFPFAGKERDQEIQLYLPLGMPSYFDPEITKSTDDVNGGTAFDRNGLREFGSDHFIDDGLKDTGSASLLNEANFMYYQEKQEKVARLKGIHSLLPIEEVTLVAVPDAVFAGSFIRDSDSQIQPLSPPMLKKPFLSDDKYSIRWNRVNADFYLIQESTDVSFRNIKRQHRYHARKTFMNIHIISKTDCPHTLFFRIRAEIKGNVSGWSNTVHILKPPSDFKDCVIGIIESPKLHTPVWEDGFLVSWEPGQTLSDIEYILEESIEPEFLAGVTIYRGNDTSFLVRRNNSKIYYFRVKRIKTQNASYESPWSNTVTTEFSQTASWAMVRPESGAVLLNIQRALLRFCFARGDMFAVLSLPVDYLEADALSHKDSIENCPGEENITSFGALYHPWLNPGTNGGKEPDTPSLLPPDGAVCGKIASVSVSGAAWLSPANVAVQGVVSLIPVIDNSGWERLYSGGINLIRHEPRGFLIMSASTLSTDPMFSNINVRRLIILLRRLSLREGALYTFQPNNENFRRIVSRRFEMLLGDMYKRGAFAGRTPEESFRVVADSSINTIQSIEQGRFIIELHVAPSLPMTFITVRLVQTGNYGLVITEV